MRGKKCVTNSTRFACLAAPMLVAIGMMWSGPANAQILLNAADLVQPSDYPQGALHRGEEGTAAFELTLENGRPASCKITGSTGYKELDDATCRLAMERSVFDMSSLPKGVRSTFTQRVRWRLNVGEPRVGDGTLTAIQSQSRVEPDKLRCVYSDGYVGFVKAGSPCIHDAAVRKEAAGQDVQVEICEALTKELKYRQYAECLQKLALDGSAEASARLALHYSNGTNVEVDYPLAAKFATAAVQKDNVLGLQILARAKAIGAGIPKNWNEALALRRRLAKIQGDLAPTWVSGMFTGHRVKETEAIHITVGISSDGIIKSCVAIGNSQDLKQLACEVVKKYFLFLPAVSRSGEEIEDTWATVVRFQAWSPPVKVDNTLPARVISGAVKPEDFEKYNLTRVGRQNVQLNLNLSARGAILDCEVKSSDLQLGRAACKIVASKFKFAPARRPNGDARPATLSLTFDLDFGTSVGAQENSQLGVSDANSAGASEKSDDPILEKSVKRCKTIGFELNSNEFRLCVKEQIDILSR